MAAKRSPILGYNHNVRYRGLVFHVQTEDSGVMSPHMFTHLFYEGVIVSTRKLVYDSGSAEDAIKSLMQAQHKAVLKDLRRGSFDDKIDQYLGNTAGLLPREGAAGAVPTDDPLLADVLTPLPAADPSEKAAAAAAAAAPAPARAPTPAAPAARTPTPPTVGAFAPIPSPGARTSSRHSAIVAAVEPPPIEPPPLEPPPPPAADDPPTLLTPPMSLGSDAVARANDEAPEIEIQLQLEVDDDRDEPAAMPHRRAARDTDISPFAQGSPVTGLADIIPRAPTPSVAILREATERARVPSDSVPPPTSPRVHASSLPPIARPITRPPRQPAVVASAVVSRPMAGGEDSPTKGGDSDAVEVYAPPPSTMADPPGASLPERPGQYSLRRSQRVAVPDSVPPRPAASPLAVPSRPTGSIRAQTDQQTAPAPSRTETPPMRPDMPRTRPQSISEAPRTTAPMVSQTIQSGGTGTEPFRRPIISPAELAAPDPRRAAVNEPHVEPPRRVSGPTLDVRGRTPTPPRITPPQVARTQSSSNSGGVVMTRPAVIVGAPAKPTTGRVRKASEENRGFGQGLISEKSLDEVILAYLSEDAEDK